MKDLPSIFLPSRSTASRRKWGKIPDFDYQILRQQGILKVGDLLRVQHNSATYNENGDHRTVFYAESAMVVHYLFDNNLVAKLATYFTLKVDRGMAIEQAFQQTFGLSTAQFDKVFRNYITSGGYKYFAITTPAEIIQKGYNLRPLGPYESDTVIADIHLHSLDYHDKAVAEFQEVLKQEPSNAAAARGLGYAYLQVKDFKQAGEYFKRAAAANSNDARVHYFSALLMYQDSAEHADAAEMTRELETAIALDPSFADAYELLGYAASRQGDTAKAFTNMQKAVSLSPRNENYRFNLAQMYLTNRQADEGITILQMLSKSSDPAIAQHAQESLIQAEQFKAAMQAARAAAAAPSRKVANSVGDGALEQSMRSQRATVETVTVLPASAPIKFLKGIVRGVDCSSAPGAALTIDSGNKAWTMRVADSRHLLVLGADGFSCDWKRQKVAINYRETGEATGTVVSIEVQ